MRNDTMKKKKKEIKDFSVWSKEKGKLWSVTIWEEKSDEKE